jgi:Membrane bound beta barrel domain (DUF5777)
MLLKILGVCLFFFAPAWTYYPGSPDRNLAVLQTAEITPNKHFYMRFNHRFEDPIAPEGENNPFYGMLGMDGPANIYVDLAAGVANLWEVTLARERQFKTYGLEAKLQAWNQRFDHKPLSVAITLNTQVRTERQVEDDKKVSFGGSLILTRSLWNDRLELLFNGLAQTHTNATERGADADHSMAAGMGVLWRYSRLSFWGEWILPLQFGDLGYRNNYDDRYREGIALQGYGFTYRIYNHAFAITVTNYTDLLAANFIAGAHQPGATRTQEWRLGFNLTRTFKVGH